MRRRERERVGLRLNRRGKTKNGVASAHGPTAAGTLLETASSMREY